MMTIKRTLRENCGSSMLPVLLLLLISPMSEAQAQQATPDLSDQTLVLSGGTLIDGTGTRPLQGSVVLIRGNRIEAVGPRSQVKIPPGARVLDTSNQFVMPGLIDSHFHAADWTPGELWLAFGVTTVFLFGERLPQAVPPGDVPTWPRVFFTGRHISGPDEWTILGKVSNAGKTTTVEEAREQVRQRRASGASFVLVSENLQTELLAAVSQEAHQLGLPVIGHQVNATEAVKAGLVNVFRLFSKQAIEIGG
jgi:hypothetical protein